MSETAPGATIYPGRAAGNWLVGARTAVLDCAHLTKPRIISLLLFTAVCSMYAAAAGGVPWPVLVALLGGGYLAPGGAHAINCALEGDLDRAMPRTRERPVAAGRISRRTAVGYGILLEVIAVGWLAAAINVLTAALALAGAAWYVLIYTMWLKRRSTENIVIGGAAGCFPILVGWAAATGSLDATAIVLAAVVFCWTPPHFWSLAVLLREDYRKARVPMLPVVASAEHTSLRMLRYAYATLIASVAPVLWDGLGFAYLVVAVLAGGRLCRLCVEFRRDPTTGAARKLFTFSLLYLAIIFLAAALDRAFGAPVL